MKSHKKEQRTKTPPEKRRAKVTELFTPPIQEEPEPVSNVLQGDDILALAIKEEDLKKQHIPRPPALEEKTVTHQVFIRKHKIQKVKKAKHHLIARPATPEAAAKPLDYSGPAEESSDGKEQILPHNILGTLYDFKRIAVARGNTELAEMIPETTGVDSVIIAVPEEPKKQPKKEKVDLWLPPAQHKSLKNWKRNMTLRKKQQEVLSEHLKKPVNQLLMNAGEGFRRVQEERSLIERSISVLYYGKGTEVDCDFWNQSDCIGDELTGLVTQWPCGYRQPIIHVGKPQSIQMESGLPSMKEPWFRFTWDKSLFLTDRRKELRCILKELDFNQPDIDGLEVVGKGHPFSSVSAEHFPILKDVKEDTSNEGTSDPLADYPDVVPMPFLGPSLLFCGKPACWIDSNLPPGESSNAGIFRESWEFGTHPTLLGGALLQVTLRAVALSQDVLKPERKSLEANLASQEAVTIVEDVLNELLRGVWSPQRASSPVDAYLTEEDLFCYRNPQLHYQHQVIRELHELWNEFMVPPAPTPPEEEEAGPVPVEDEVIVPKFPMGSDKSIMGEKTKGTAGESHKGSKGTPSKTESKAPLLTRKSTIFKVIESQKELEEEAVEAPEESDTMIPEHPKWNLCVDDFKKAVLDLPEEEQREDALTRLNKGALELCLEQRPLQSDLLYQMCFQLWRDVIDGLVSHSMWLKSLLGLPEKDTVYIQALEEHEAKPSGKIGKEERKPAAQEKKQSGGKEKEEKKGGAKSPGREDRANSRKHKGGREEKKLQKSPTRDGKERTSLEELPREQSASPFEPVDPLIQEKYNQRLYIEVYGLLDSLVTDMMLLFDELETSTATQQETLEPLESFSFSA
ncbi:MYCBP-associated protein isoform X2 [Notamacropus eugenii]|uniref:MYCBP-associated protein isoform X2 n=1 Tax=Notamacropus eugenii TaxID=9315 RepID=UPI003B66E248